MAGIGLGEAVERHMLAPFRWGENDCTTAVANVLVEMGRPDIAAPFRGIYSDAESAARVGRVAVRAAGRFADLGWPEVAPSEARDGDIGVLGNSLAIRCGGQWVAKSEAGYVCKPRVRRAWRPM